MSLLSVETTALIDWSRAQFAITAMYHWLFVPLTLGLSLIVAVMETIYVRTNDEFWKRTTQFWMKLFGINFAIGVATGIILEFQFGTNWSNYSWFVGDIFGAPLAIEGILAFFMESTFVAVMFFGWDKVSKKFHCASSWLTAIGASISAWWILVANSWMQHPVGMTFNPDTARNEMMDFFHVAFQPFAVFKFFHSVLSGWMTGAAFVIAIACWFLLRNRERRFALASIRIAAIVGLIGTIGVAGSGDQSGVLVAKYQPMKLAAAEGLQDGGKGAAFSVIPGVEIPKVLSILATHDAEGMVPGYKQILEGYTDNDGNTHASVAEKIANGKKALEAFRLYRELRDTDPTQAAIHRKVLDENVQFLGYGYLNAPEDLIPNSGLVYWCFRLMVYAGGALLLMFVLMWWFERKGKLSEMRSLLYIGLWSLLLVYLAGQAGWIVAEVGRQPWAIQDLLPVNAAISSLSVEAVQTTFFLFVALFTIMLIAEVRILCNAIKKGPAGEPIEA